MPERKRSPQPPPMPDRIGTVAAVARPIRATTPEMIPQLKLIAEKMMNSLELYPSSPYTGDTVVNLDRIMCLIDRCEGIESMPLAGQKLDAEWTQA